ncbi:MAG: DUF1549 domain-containing protein [Planctomicrobium sp.]|nr:DUF1549 domain-containing protein [Planctomicrobium sp.]
MRIDDHFLKVLIGMSLMLISTVTVTVAVAETPQVSAAELEFFESKVRPVLVEHCYDCHNSTETAEGGFILDHRSALREGGQSGPPLNFETPSKSLLLKVIRHDIAELEMPQGEDQIPQTAIQDIEKWIAMGAPDPRTTPPAGASQVGETGWQATLVERKKWWSFQPITLPEPPVVKNQDWSDKPIDQFILTKLEENNLKPESFANRRVLIRRLSFVLRGLPPSPTEVEQFLQDDSEDAYEKVVDEFLASPAFGEHWARHFMDLVRYAESHGSEGDPRIPHAWKYRDYLIRALNEDVPYDQIVKEHVAGDLLEEPRINKDLNINESTIAPAHWRMCFHGFAPTDALDEKVRFIDDEINVFSKAFLGMTVSCARCHNHKFDPISQTDYYALFGIVGSARPGIVDINPLSTQVQFKSELVQLKNSIRKQVGQTWEAETNQLADNILQKLSETPEEELNSPAHLLHPFVVLKQNNMLDSSSLAKVTSPSDLPEDSKIWDFQKEGDFNQWFVHGNGSATRLAPPGEFTIPPEGSDIGPLLNGGVYSHLESTKHRNVLSSPHFDLDGKYEVWIKVSGDSQAIVRYVVQDYPRNGTVYPVTTLQGGKWKWQRYDLSYWEGEEIHIEISTAADSAVLARDIDRSWFGVQQVVVAPPGAFKPPQDHQSFTAVLNHSEPAIYRDRERLVKQYVSAIQAAVSNWKNHSASDQQIALLNEVRRMELLSNPNSKELQRQIKEYQELESQVALPNRIVGLLEADAKDQSLYIRGNHKQPSSEIPRRILEAIDSSPYETNQSGRYQLAMSIIDEGNPLTSRVIVNRLWHYIFGSGIVRTVDNFGQLGEEPSHPELLDYLASRIQSNDWSLKQMIREMLLTKTFQLAATSSTAAEQLDPENRLLSHANVRRLTGEEIRDSLLSVSGRIDGRMYGPPVGNSTDNPRRSVYLTLRRNSLNPFLETFDAPVPFAPKGRRDSTNVPAQSLTMLNDSFVITSARSLFNQIDQRTTTSGKIQRLFERALTRPASALELKAAESYLSELEEFYAEGTIERSQLTKRLQEQQSKVSVITQRVRKQLMETKQDPKVVKQEIAPPIAEWNFEGTPQDSYGQLHGELKNGAKIVDGALVLDGKGYFASPPLQTDLREKTLEVIALVQDLNQRGGGLLTVQDLQGVIFDAIVYGEQQPRHWIAGSNNFARTQSFAGTEENSSPHQPVHITITYSSDGKIQCYRNGIPYGKEYQSNGPVHFQKDKTQVLIGLRHGQPGGNRMFQGKILSAKLYNRKLTSEEVAISAGNTDSVISESEIRKAMTPEQIKLVDSAHQDIEEINQRLMKLGDPPEENQAWVDLAHSIFNLKEFIYIR